MSAATQTLAPALEWNSLEHYRSNPLTVPQAKIDSGAPESVTIDRHEGFERRVKANAQNRTQPFTPAPEIRPVAPGKPSSFGVAQEWEGIVDEVGISHFTSRLKLIDEPVDATDIVEIPIGDIPRQNRDMLVPGAVFRYLAGYAKDNAGTVQRRRLVYFRRGRLRQKVKVLDSWLKIAAHFDPDE